MANRDGILVSLIVPVYNKAEYLEACTDSLSEQTLSKNKLEAIFVDDGSSDGSDSLLDEFANKYDWVTVIHKENGGVCSARNTGIARARGKYLFYLDADDSIAPETLEAVSSFFDELPPEIEIVTYPIVPVRNGKIRPKHYRYNYLTESGVYDLTQGDNVFACQTTMNIAVRNHFENNILFDFKTNNGIEFHEDQNYINSILKSNFLLGYCAEGMYYWQQNSSSTVQNVVSSMHLFDNTINMYEQLFSSYPENVPEYYQALLLSDAGWKIRSNALLPTHLHGGEYIQAMNRFVKLLRRVDDELLMRHPGILLYHKLYFARLKHAEGLSCKVGTAAISIEGDDTMLYASNTVELTINRFACRDNRLHLFACLKSPCFDFIGKSDDVSLILRRKNQDGIQEQKVRLFDSSWSYVSCHTHTNTLYSFESDLPLSDHTRYSFILRIKEYRIPLEIKYNSFAKHSVWFNDSFLISGWRVKFGQSDASIAFSKLSNKQFNRARKKLRNRFLRRKDRLLRATLDAAVKLKHRQIWLYSDSVGKTDNAWIQFLHDSKKKDGVLRFYVNHGADLGSKVSFSFRKILEFGSARHKVLFCLADKLLCSDIALASYRPFTGKASKKLLDYFNAEKVYLQHGVLWAHMPWYYSNDRVMFDKTVVSTKFEVDNLLANYRYKDHHIIQAGMPRYSLIDVNAKPCRRILFCPSWRSYLIGPLTPSGRRPDKKKFLGSEYYANIQAVLKSERLNAMLDAFGYELDLKLHPLFSCYRDCFTTPSNRMRVVDGHIHDSDYDIVITDYSSYSFDFVYLQRALIYYIPDEDLFYAGVNSYNRLDLSLDDAYGEYVHSSDELLDALSRILNNDGKPLPEYLRKMENVFIHRDQAQCERIYDAINSTNEIG